jgi:uncharacterized membrane protein
MRHRTTASTAIQLSITAIFTSLVFIATVIFSIYVPLTEGFFNIGESMVYTTALLFGPLVGGFAGGVGSTLADFFLGYPHYAPATLIVKACEGVVVGVLAKRKLRLNSKLQWKTFTVTFGLIAGVLLGTIGAFYYSGSMELYIGFPPPENPTLNLFVPTEFWYVLGVLVALSVGIMGFVVEPEFGWLIITVLIGGSVMVIGYFTYQYFFLGPLFGYDVVAIAEIPINIGQMTIGLIVGLPIVRAIRRSLPFLKS